MEAHNISDVEMLAAGASARSQRAGAQTTPPNWEARLAGRIADAFGCRVIFQPAVFIIRTKSNWLYIGCGPSPEIAGYAFGVLHSQCKRARAEHIKARLKRCGTATKTRRADLFCEGWVSIVVDKIDAFAGNDAQRDAIEAYVATNFPTLRNLDARDRNGDRALRGHEYGDWLAGRAKGAGAELNRGVGGDEQRQIGG